MVVCVRDVLVGEEITVGYGRMFWMGRERDCRCGERGCLGDGG